MIVEEDCIEAVRGFTYLGATISEDGIEEAEVRRRTALANKAYFVLITTFKSRVILTEKDAHIQNYHTTHHVLWE